MNKNKLGILELLIVVMVFGFLAALFPPRVAAGGADVCEIGISSGTNFVKCATKSTDLTLYRVDFETATIGDFIVCFDSAPATYATGLVLGNDGSIVNGVKRLAFSSMTVTGAGSNPVDNYPVNASKGVTCAKSNAGARARVKLSSR